MKLPKTLIICDTHWKVKRKKRLGRGTLAGLCVHDDLTIFVDSDLNDADTLSTLIHEVIHAIEFSLGLNIKHELVHKMEAPLASVLLQLATLKDYK